MKREMNHKENYTLVSFFEKFWDDMQIFVWNKVKHTEFAKIEICKLSTCFRAKKEMMVKFVFWKNKLHLIEWQQAWVA